MFTGIIQQVGTVQKLGKTLEIKVELPNKKIGDSIAVDGVCLTITKISETGFTVDVMDETLNHTTLGDFKIDSKVNLEPAMTSQSAFDGHFVTGHVDTTGEVLKTENGTLQIKFGDEFGKFMAWKGSITINGVSLTITDIREDSFEVELIPHTLKITNLGNLKKGDKVNLEVDILARYIKKMLDQKENEVTYDFLKERNLL